MESERDPRRRLPLAALLLLIAVGGLVDLVMDAPTTLRSAHVIYELFLIVAAVGMAAWLWLGWRGAERTNAALHRLMSERQAERDQWLAGAEQALAGLAVAIDHQLGVWGLTRAEREVVVMLLKGKSHKEIAVSTDRSERTVRQHAAAAYRKAGLGGRAELAAYFLMDLPVLGSAGETRGYRDDNRYRDNDDGRDEQQQG